MKHPSQEDLLGYVLGALDAQEERDLQEHIDANPEVEEQLLELRNSMRPLESLSFGQPGHRPGLARRTCELVANMNHGKRDFFESFDAVSQIGEIFDDQPACSASDSSTERELKPAFAFSRITDRLVHPRSWSRVDVLAGVAILAIFASILLPAISQSRFHGRVNSCQHNLKEVGTAMLVYSDLHCGRFIDVAGANLSVGNNSLFGPVLKGRGFITDDALFSCAGRTDGEAPRIPTLQQIRSAEGSQLEALKRRLGGHFGYSLGFFEGNKYFAPRNDGSAHTVIIADAPSAELPGRASKNHSGKGQNCFFADGHCKFIPTHAIGDDAIYENDLGIVGPGVNVQDNVIAPGHVPAVRVHFEVLETQ